MRAFIPHTTTVLITQLYHSRASYLQIKYFGFPLSLLLSNNVSRQYILGTETFLSVMQTNTFVCVIRE